MKIVFKDCTVYVNKELATDDDFEVEEGATEETADENSSTETVYVCYYEETVARIFKYEKDARQWVFDRITDLPEDVMKECNETGDGQCIWDWLKSIKWDTKDRGVWYEGIKMESKYKNAW